MVINMREYISDKVKENTFVWYDTRFGTSIRMRCI